MSVVQAPNPLLEEFAELLATGPRRERILEFQPSAGTVAQARRLLERSKSGEATEEEEHELSMYHQAELLLRLIKARLRSTDEA